MDETIGEPENAYRAFKYINIYDRDKLERDGKGER